MNKTNRFIRGYRFMIILAIIVGLFGVIFQFIPGFADFYFFLPLAVVGGLIGGSNDYEEQDRQQLEQSYKLCFGWLLLVILAAYAFIVFSRWLPLLEGAAIFLNSHWPGLIISIMCALLGGAGFHRARGS